MNKVEEEKELIIITKGAGFSFLGRILGKAIGLIVTVVLTNVLGSTSYGLYSLGLVIIKITSMFARFGLNNAVVKYVSAYLSVGDKSRVRGVIIQSAFFSTLFGVFAGAILYILSGQIAFFFNKPNITPVLKIFSFGIPLLSLLPVLGGAARGCKNTKPEVVSTHIVTPLVNLLAIFVVYFLGYRLLGVVWAYIAGFLAGNLILAAYILKLFPELKQRGLSPAFETGKLLSTSGPLMLIGVTIFFIHCTDTLMVAYFLPAEKIGIYRVAVRIATLQMVFLTAFNSIFAPIISDFHHRDEKEKLHSLFKTVTRWGFSLALMVFIIIVVSPCEILRMFGGEFVSGQYSLIILSIGQLVSVGTGGVGIMLMMTGMEKLEFVNSVMTLIMNVVMNILLIPRFGIVGAAIATAFSIIIINFIRVIEIYLRLHCHPFSLKFMVSMVAGALSIFIIILFKNYFFNSLHHFTNLALSSITVVILFVSFLFLFGFEEADKFILREVKQRLCRIKQ